MSAFLPDGVALDIIAVSAVLTVVIGVVLTLKIAKTANEIREISKNNVVSQNRVSGETDTGSRPERPATGRDEATNTGEGEVARGGRGETASNAEDDTARAGGDEAASAEKDETANTGETHTSHDPRGDDDSDFTRVVEGQDEI